LNSGHAGLDFLGVINVRLGNLEFPGLLSQLRDAVAGSAAHIPTPMAATAASADITTAILFASSHRTAASTTASAATTPAVTIMTVRHELMPTSPI